jgi:hypothetical protein
MVDKTVLLDGIARLARQEIASPFLTPVTDAIAPGYLDVVQTPMDLETMRAKIVTDQYHRLNEVSKDFKLIFENCHAYNDPKSNIVSQAKSVRNFGLGLVKSCSVRKRQANRISPTSTLPKRTRKSRIVTVDGEPVLKVNTQGAILQGDEVAGDKVTPKIDRKPLPPQDRPRVVTRRPIEQRRLEHNSTIKLASAWSAIKRGDFLLQPDIWATFGYFVGEEGRAGLLNESKRAGLFIQKMGECSKERLDQQQDSLQPTITWNALARQPKWIVSPSHHAMKPYQLAGVEWLMGMHRNGCSAILGDEMGLGKTLQTISFLAHLKYGTKPVQTGPHLVVAPLSVLGAWASECKSWCPSLRVVKFHSSDKHERLRLVQEELADVAGI